MLLPIAMIVSVLVLVALLWARAYVRNARRLLDTELPMRPLWTDPAVCARELAYTHVREKFEADQVELRKAVRS